MWFWICLIIPVIFLITWFRFGLRLVGEDDFKKLFVKFILIIIIADCLLTIAGQSSYYWQNYSSCNEFNFIGKALLNLHPFSFVLGSILWMVLITFLIKKMNLFLSSVLFFAVCIGHSIGVWSWIHIRSENIIKNLIGENLNHSWSSAFEEISSYILYVFIGLIFACILNKIWKK